MHYDNNSLAMPVLTSAQNPVIRAMKALKDKKARLESGLMLVEGEKLMREAALAGLHPADALIDSEKSAQYGPLAAFMTSHGANVYAVPAHLIGSVCDTKTPQGACAAFHMPLPFDLGNPPERIVALDGVQDPGNVGTIWRTADAAGFQGMLMSAACADPFSPKVQRSSMGSGFRLPVHVTADFPDALRRLQGLGYAVIASTLHGEPFFEANLRHPRFALIIGNEARGVSDEALALADVRVTLPMRGGAESLNAAVAAGIMMYELTR